MCDFCNQDECTIGECESCGAKNVCVQDCVDPYIDELEGREVSMGIVCEDCVYNRWMKT